MQKVSTNEIQIQLASFTLNACHASNGENGVTFSSKNTQKILRMFHFPAKFWPLPVANAFVNPNKEFPARSYLNTFDYVLDNYILQLCQQVIGGVLEQTSKFNSHSILTPDQHFPSNTHNCCSKPFVVVIF